MPTATIDDLISRYGHNWRTANRNGVTVAQERVHITVVEEDDPLAMDALIGRLRDKAHGLEDVTVTLSTEYQSERADLTVIGWRTATDERLAGELARLTRHMRVEEMRLKDEEERAIALLRRRRPDLVI